MCVYIYIYMYMVFLGLSRDLCPGNAWICIHDTLRMSACVPASLRACVPACLRAIIMH